MSKVIKKSIKLDDVVAIGEPQSTKENLPRKQPKKSTKDSLDFKSEIESAIENYVSVIEQSKVDEAFQRKYKQGYNDGLEKERADRENYIDKHFSDRIKIIESLLIEAKKKKEKAFRGLEKNIINLAVRISEKLIHKSIESDPGIVETIVSEAMQRMISSEIVILKVSSDDYQLINSKYDKWFGMAGNVKEFRIEIDKRLSSGDCLIETEGGIIDALISSRLDVLAEELLKINK